MFRLIMVPLDGSKTSESALDYARELSRNFDSRVLLFHVLSGEPGEGPGRAAYLEECERHLGEHGVAATFELVPGSPAEAILDRCGRGDVDLVVLSSCGQKGLTRFLVGSVAERVARHAECPVMIVHRRLGTQ